MKEEYYLQFDIRELFHLGPFGISLVTCIVYAQLGVHALLDFLTLFLPFYFLISRYFLHVNPDSASNVTFASNDLKSTCYIEIGGQQHDLSWTERLRRSFLQTLRKDPLYGLKAFHVDLCLNLHSGVSLDIFGTVLGALSLQNRYCGTSLCINSGSRRPSPVLELNITIPKYPGIEDEMRPVIQRSNINLQHLAPNLQKLTWRGPFAEFLFTRPPYRTVCDAIFQRDKEAVTFSALTELRLLDCTVDLHVLLEILVRCPVLTTLEVQTVGSSSLSSSDLADSNHVLQGRGLLQHLHLRHLKLSSTVPLSPLFKSLHLLNLETLSLDLAPSAMIFRPEIDIPRLSIPWNVLAQFELRAPMEYCSMDSLNRFLCLEPSIWRRSHVLSDNRYL